MRAGLLLVAIALAGCLAPADRASDVPGLPFHAAGETWIPATAATQPYELEIPCEVNGTGMRVEARITIGETYGGTQVTGSTSQVNARLFDPRGNVVDEEGRGALESMHLALEARDPPVGTGRLVLTLQGRSDGSANGDHVAYTIDVT